MINLTRRTLLSSSVAAVALPKVALATPMVLRAEPVSLQILPEPEKATALFGFNGSSPGPELRVRQHERLSLRFENRTDQPSALHWHGIRLRNAMDGVPGMTQPLVQPGESFDYDFTVPDAGTYWYHAHHRSWEQVARGLYGPLIIEERTPPAVDADITVVLDDWRLEEDGTMMGGFGNLHDFSHGGRMGNYALMLPSHKVVRRGDRVRLRLINTATARVFPVRIEGVNAKVVAFDGMPLTTPRDLSDIELAPAQRVDLIGDVTDAVNFLFVARDALFDMGTITIEGDNPAPSTAPIPTLAQSALPLPSDAPDQTLTLRMQGGAMGGGHNGDDIWAFNGVSGLPQTPFAQFKQGQTAIIELINDTSWPHGIHLHGHHFYELDTAGAIGDLRDTTLLHRGQSRKIAVVFDNPGKWLMHCHMLGHQASGMKTWVEVV